MKLSELLRKLSQGELQNLALSGSGSAEIQNKHRPKIVDYINDGLTELYGEFVLREKDVLIQMDPHVTNYHLLRRFSRSNGDDCECQKYILDHELEPFEEDVIRILSIFDSFGTELPLNDEELRWSCFTPQANVLQIPRPVPNQAISIHYQARHPVVADEDDSVITVPLVLEEALRAFVAYKAMSHLGSDGSSAKAQEHYTLYEARLAKVRDRDLVGNTTSTTNTRFHKRGWV